MANNMSGGQPGLFGFDPTVGVNSIQRLTLFSSGSPNSVTTQQAVAQAQSTPASNGAQFAGEPLAVWIGFIFLLLIIKFFSERPKSNLNPAYVKVNGLNFIVVGALAGVFVILMKVIFNHFKVYGFTDFANAL